MPAHFFNNRPGLAVDLTGAFSKTAKAIENRNARAKELYLERKAQEASNRESLLEDLKYNPEVLLVDYQKEISDQLNNDYMSYSQEIHKGSRIPTAEEEVELKRRQYAIDGKVERLKDHRESMDAVREILDKDSEGRYNLVNIERMLRESRQDENGEKLSVEDLQPDQLRETIFSQAESLNAVVVIKSFVDNIDENKETILRAGSDGAGSFRQRSMQKTNLYVMENGIVKYDTDGRPILKITPYLLNLAMKDGDMEILIEDEKESKGLNTNLEALRNLLEPVAKYESERESIFGKVGAGEENKKEEEEAAIMRNLDRVVYDKDEAVLASFIDHKNIFAARFDPTGAPAAEGQYASHDIVLTVVSTKDTDGSILTTKEIRISRKNPQKALAELANLKSKVFKGTAVQKHLDKHNTEIVNAVDPVFDNQPISPLY